MAEIHLLDASVYNKISAGEVVEKPASVVKELVENALDAGATDISIRIVGGGLDEITVSDNGKGIALEDLPYVFFPHATSKISTADDLFDVHTLGFRGEAMASIAAVSMVSLTTRQEGREAYRIESSGGVIGEPTLSAGAVGTTVTVRNLFYHTPARLKFLRSAKQEGRDIISLVERLIIANPTVRFELYADGKLCIQSSGESLDAAVSAVFGEEAFAHMLPIEKSEYGYTVRGFVSDTDYTAGTKSNQITVVNGRVISNATLSASINNAYRDFLMKRNYAVFALHILMPKDEVDVNVHPTKADVRFTYANKLFGLCYRVVRKALEDYLTSRDILFDNPQDKQSDSAPISTIEHTELSVDDSYKPLFAEHNDYLDEYRAYQESLFTSAKENKSAKVDEVLTAVETAQIKAEEDLPFIEEVAVDLLHNQASRPNRQDEPVERFDTSALRVVGQVLGTYIIAEYLGDMLLIDQHAAAERVLYNRVIEQYASDSLVIQPMLIPYEFALSEEESDVLYTRLEDIKALGIDIERTSDTSFALSGVPALLVDMDVNQFVHLLLSDDFDGDSKQLLHEKLAYTACRAAIKGNNYMDLDAIKLLCDNLFGKALPSHCPHGRPAYIRLTKYQLDKMFKRIV